MSKKFPPVKTYPREFFCYIALCSYLMYHKYMKKTRCYYI